VQNDAISGNMLSWTFFASDLTSLTEYSTVQINDSQSDTLVGFTACLDEGYDEDNEGKNQRAYWMI